MDGTVRKIVAAIFAMSLSVEIAAQPATGSLTTRIAAAAVELDAPMAGRPVGLDRLGEAIGDARIVLLGEPWHGDGGAIAQRARIVEYLHEKKDFDVLVFESDFYALDRGAEQIGPQRAVSAIAAENVYAFWSQTRAAAPLWRYIDATQGRKDPLRVAGIDTKVFGALSHTRLPDELRERLRRLAGTDPARLAQAERAANVFATLMHPTVNAAALTNEDFSVLAQQVSALAQQYRAVPEDSFWTQMAQSLNRQLAGENRDPGMAENLIWLATVKYPGKKIIVWAHNNHVLTDKWMFYGGDGAALQQAIASEPADSIGRRVYLGAALRDYFGPQVYALATLSYCGRYSDDIGPALVGDRSNFDHTVALSPAAPGTLEAALHASGRKVAFVDLHAFAGERQTVSSRVLDYTQLQALSMRLWQGYDGLLYLDRTQGLNASADDEKMAACDASH